MWVRLLMFVGGGFLTVIGFFGMVAIFVSIPLLGIASALQGFDFPLGQQIGGFAFFFALFLTGIFLMKAAFSGE